MPNEKVALSKRAIISEITSIVLGSIIYGISVAIFLGPSGTVMGGATGVATTINILFPNIPIGTMILILNVPLLLIGLKLYGWRILWRIVVAVISTSVSTNLFELLNTSITDDPLLAAIMGGLLLGVGSGMLIARGYNTGGSDLAGVMLKKSLIHGLSTGRIIFILDLFVVGGSALITQNLHSVFYSVISIYAYSFAVDYVIDGNKSAKMTIIVSEKYDELSQAFADELDRGVTLLNGKGWYSGAEKHVILCVFMPQELLRAKLIVKRVDPSAFMILTDAKEVMGEGFLALDL